MDMFESVASESSGVDGVVPPVNFDKVMDRMSEMDMFESVASESSGVDGVVPPVNFDKVMDRMSEMDISLLGFIEYNSGEIISGKLSICSRLFVMLSCITYSELFNCGAISVLLSICVLLSISAKA
jgi:hypothetical protein